MTKTKLANIVKLIGTIVTAVAAIWIGPTAQGTLDQKIAQTLIVGCALALNAAEWSKIQNVFLSVATMGGLILSFVAMKLPVGSAAASVVPVILAVWTDLTKALGQNPVPITQDFAAAAPDKISRDIIAKVRDTQKGSISFDMFKLMATIIVAAGLLFVLLWPMLVRAEPSQQFGGCASSGKVCFGPSATISVGQFNFSNSKFSGGVLPGVGYGATFEPDQWYATGLALYASFLVGQGQPNNLTPSLMLSFANYVRVGAGMSITEQSTGPTKRDWLLLFGLGSDFGGSPSYVKQKISAAMGGQ